MLSYVATAEWTGDETTDSIRRQLLELLVGGGVCLNGKNDRIDRLWSEYQAGYAAYFVAKHAYVMSANDVEGLTSVLSSEMWSAFRAIAELPFIDRRFLSDAEGLVRQMRSGGCNADAGAHLATQPTCLCGKSLRDLGQMESSAGRLLDTIDRAMNAFRSVLLSRKHELVVTATRIRPGSNIQFLMDGLEAAKPFPRLTARDLLILRDAASQLPMVDLRVADIQEEHELELLSL